MRWLALALALASASASAQPQPQPGWEIRVPERVEVAVGASTQVPITIAVDRGLAVSRDAPVIVDLTADAGVAIKKKRLLRADAVDPGADAPRFTATAKGDAEGDHVVRIRVRLWLCGGKVCRPLDVRRQAIVAVTPPPN